MNATQEAILEILHEGPSLVSDMVARTHRRQPVIHNALKQMAEAGVVRVKEIRKAPKTSKPARVWEAVE